MGLPMLVAAKDMRTDDELFEAGRHIATGIKNLIGEFRPIVLELTSRGYSERDIASRCGISKGTVHSIAKGAQVGQLVSKDLEPKIGCDLRHCSMQELLTSGITPDAIITDPPYPAEYLPLFGELAALAAALKVPTVAVMSGQWHLPKVFNLLNEHLRYRWTLAYMTPGPSTTIWPARMNTAWKPVLLFGEFGDETPMMPTDVAVSRVEDKEHHEWGQSESGMDALVSLLSRPGDLVCDPFLGGGTTAVSCVRLGRRFVGCDVEEQLVKLAQQRCTEVLDERGSDGFGQGHGIVGAASDVGSGALGG